MTSRTSLRSELLLALFLIALGVATRLLPHALNFSPVVASALFAGMAMNRRSLALAVPVLAMLLGDLMLGFYEWQVVATVYVASALPAAFGMLARHWRPALVVLPIAFASSLIFFATTNFAVWAFGGLYSLDLAGLIQCYTLALPFLKYTVAGDLFWTMALFGGAWLLQRRPARSHPALTPSG